MFLVDFVYGIFLSFISFCCYSPFGMCVMRLEVIRDLMCCVSKWMKSSISEVGDKHRRDNLTKLFDGIPVSWNVGAIIIVCCDA